MNTWKNTTQEKSNFNLIYCIMVDNKDLIASVYSKKDEKFIVIETHQLADYKTFSVHDMSDEHFKEIEFENDEYLKSVIELIQDFRSAAISSREQEELVAKWKKEGLL
jgi:hypothetical protein